MRLNRRLEAITGLSTASLHSEALQVIIRPGCIGINRSKVVYCGAKHERPSASHTHEEKKPMRLVPSSFKISFLCSVVAERGRLAFSVVQNPCSSRTFNTLFKKYCTTEQANILNINIILIRARHINLRVYRYLSVIFALLGC